MSNVTIYLQKHLTWEGSVSVTHYEIIVDSESDLPSDEYYFGADHKIAMGSIAWVITASEFYMYNSSHQWIKQTT